MPVRNVPKFLEGNGSGGGLASLLVIDEPQPEGHGYLDLWSAA